MHFEYDLINPSRASDVDSVIAESVYFKFPKVYHRKELQITATRGRLNFDVSDRLLFYRRIPKDGRWDIEPVGVDDKIDEILVYFNPNNQIKETIHISCKGK